MDEKKQRELARLIGKLRGLRGTGTELISLYIPSGYPLAEISAKLRNEYSQAANIKSKATRKNVQSALEKILGYLKIFKETPQNGLAIFCGNVSQERGVSDIQLFAISPPEPIKVQLYHCDSQFLLDPLIVERRRERFGLIAMDGKEATLAILEGNVYKIVKDIPYLGPSKTVKGGSAAARYDRTLEEAKENYFKRVGAAMDEIFLPSGIRKVIIGGPGPVKETFAKLRFFNYQFELLPTIDIGYTGEYGIIELVDKVPSIIAEEKAIRAKELFGRFMKEIVKEGLAVYGAKEVITALEQGKVEILLLSEKLALKHAMIRCINGHESEIFVEEPAKQTCKECSKAVEVINEIDLFDELYDKATEKGIKVEVLSSETVEGAQFLVGFKGVGALLKYK